MTADDLVLRLRGDHLRGCEGRTYKCTCGYQVVTDEAADAIEALQADAARYRWLRSVMWWRTDPFAQDVGNMSTGYWQTKLFKQVRDKPDLDAAIDAAMKDGK